MSFVPHADEASWKQNGTSAARRSYTQRDYDLLGVGSWALEQGPAFRSDDSVSSKSSGDMHPKLAEYFRTSAEVSRIQDGIAKLEMKHSEESARRELLKDQHRPLEISDSTFERSFEWERSTLKMNLDNAYNKAQILKEECISLGLDVESTKQRRKSRTNLRQTISQPNLYSLNAWLQNNSGHADHVPAMVSGLMPTGERYILNSQPSHRDAPIRKHMLSLFSVQDLQQLAKLGVLEKFKALSVTGANNVLQRERRATKEPSLRSQEYPHSATVKETQPSSSSNGLRLSTRGRTQVPIRHELRDQPISRSLNGFQRQPRSFFTFGKVFLTLWAEPAGEKSMPHNSESPGSQTGKYVISNVRTFVIIREDVNHCIALPVQTYSGRGVAKPGIKKSDHCIVYSGPTPPLPRPDEAPSKGETGLQVWPIRVDAVRRGDKLDQMCRLNFGKTYTVEHNIKVRSFGMVNPAFQKQLLLQFRASWGSAVSSYSAEIPYAELKQSVQAQKSHTIPAYGLTPADVVANPNVSYDVNHGIGETQSSTQITAGSCPSVRSFNPNGSNQSGKTMRVRRASDSRSEDVQRGPPSSCSCLRCDKNFDTVLDRSKHERIHRERSFESPRAVEDDEESLNTGSDHVTCRSNTSDHFQERAIVQPQYENDTGLAEARSDQTTLRMASLLPGFESRSSVNTVEVSSQMPKLGVDGTFAWMKRMNAGQNDALLKPGNEWIERVKARDHV